MTIWNLLLLIDLLANIVVFVGCWSWILSSALARGTYWRAVIRGPYYELRPILRESLVLMTVTGIIWQAHDGSLDGWDFLAYGCWAYCVWRAYTDDDGDDRWGKRFRRLRAALRPGKVQPETA